MKRFTDTEKWDDSWFRKLSPADKCFWEFIVDRCDNAGVWKVDAEAAEFFIGCKLDLERLMGVFSGRIRDIGRGRWWVTGFIAFQCGELSEACIPHKKIVQKLKEHGLYEEYKTTLHDRVGTTHKEEEEEEEEEEEKTGDSKGGESLPVELPAAWPRDAEEAVKRKPVASKATDDQVRLYWNEGAARGGKDIGGNIIPNFWWWVSARVERDKGRAAERKFYGNGNQKNSQPNPRNVGIAGDAEERKRRLVETIARRQEANKQLGNGMAAAQPPDDGHASNGSGSG